MVRVTLGISAQQYVALHTYIRPALANSLLMFCTQKILLINWATH